MGRVGTPELSVVIPTIDVLSDRVRRCLETVRAGTDTDYELIIVDNHAPHQGYTAPVNAGVRASQGDYIVIMNDDVEVREHWWPPLKESLDAGAYAALPNGATPKLDLLRFRASCIAFSREGIDRVRYSPNDFFDPQFKIWFQDIDLFLELCRVGRPPVVAEASRIVHHGAQTVRTEDRTLKDWVAEQIKQDMEAFSRKWPGGRRGAAAQELVQRLSGQAYGD
jgi:glycosyltransferase involved in cell wall biosynthesis